MKIRSSIWWFLGCALAVLWAFIAGSESIASYFFFLVGVLGMMASLILMFIPRVTAAERVPEPAAGAVPAETRKKRHGLLGVWCVLHMVFLDAAAGGLLRGFGLQRSGVAEDIFVIAWLVLLAVWPLWLVVLVKDGWRASQIMIPLLIGLLILSPVVLFVFFLWALAHSGGC